MNAQMKKGVLELCTLTALAGKDRYGYELTERISREISISPATLYLILKRLKDDGCVETYLCEASEGPARKYYHLTEKGRVACEEQKNEWIELRTAVDRMLDNESDDAAQ